MISVRNYGWQFKRGKIMKKKTKILIAGVAAAAIAVAALIWKTNILVNREGTSISVIGGADGPTSVFIAGKLPGGGTTMTYTSITMKEAKEIFQKDGDYIILDVRRADEFASGHIPGAINIANEDIVDEEPEALADKNQTIYVYCRSGNRSKQASAKLAAMGYTNIIEFGGILDWTGTIEK